MTALRKALASAIGLAVLATATLAMTSAGGADAGRGMGELSSPINRAAASNATAFAWLRPAPPLTGWSTRRLASSPARLSAPPGWRPAPGDPGTQTMVTRGPSGSIVGYLNATPRQGDESAANWSVFRVAHNREEGDRDVRRLAFAAGLRFRTGTGACVIDSYSTTTSRRYREIACLVSGRAASSVIVAAAPPSRWASEAPQLERAVSNFTT